MHVVVCRPHVNTTMPWTLRKRRGANPHFNICSNGGNLKNLRQVDPPPEELRRLLCDSDADSRQIRKNIRTYNNAFAFVSYGKKCFGQATGGGAPVVQVHGTAYHMAG